MQRKTTLLIVTSFLLGLVIVGIFIFVKDKQLSLGTGVKEPLKQKTFEPEIKETVLDSVPIVKDLESDFIVSDKHAVRTDTITIKGCIFDPLVTMVATPSGLVLKNLDDKTLEIDFGENQKLVIPAQRELKVSLKDAFIGVRKVSCSVRGDETKIKAGIVATVSN